MLDIYIPMTYLSYNYRFVPSDSYTYSLNTLPTTYHQPLPWATINLQILFSQRNSSNSTVCFTSQFRLTLPRVISNHMPPVVICLDSIEL